MSFQIPRRDAELRLVTKFGENRLLWSCQKVLWITTKKLGLREYAGIVPAPILPKMDRSRPKFPERCHPLTCPCIPNLVRFGCALLDLFRKDCFFGPKSNYNIGFQSTTMQTRRLNKVGEVNAMQMYLPDKMAAMFYCWFLSNMSTSLSKYKPVSIF